jgi:hypothetical protein
MLSGFFFVQICSKTFKNVYYSWCIHGAKILYIVLQSVLSGFWCGFGAKKCAEVVEPPQRIKIFWQH